MCGIDGIALPRGLVSEIDIKKMTALMDHRGPDGQGSFVKNNIGLGHRRLRIIDLSERADQPLFNEKRDIAIVFNGEIYNYRELRKTLIAKGHTFHTQSDTEVIVEAFEEWGTESFLKLNGIFAFSIWDGRGKSPILYLVRDRFGTKPLFYAYKDQKLAFASELKPLLQVPWIEKKVNPETLFYFLKFSHVPQPNSIIEDIQQLHPGSWLKFENGGLQEQKFWDVASYSGNEGPDFTEAEWLLRLDDSLKESVARQMVSDVPVGCFLSGGIDSSLLVRAHSALKMGPLKTFTIGYKEAQFDESSHASQVARVFNTQHYQWTAEPQDFYDIIPDLPSYFDQPFADPTAMASVLLSRFASEEVTVTLSGDGGDELFFGYPYQHALLNLQLFSKIPLGVRQALFESVRRVGFGIRSRPIQQALKISDIFQFKSESELFQYFIGTLGPLRLDRLANLFVTPPHPVSFLDKVLGEELSTLSWREKIEQIFLRTFLVDTVLAKTDRAGMAFGLEARVPFLDNEMVEFASRLPFHWKYRRGQGKYLLRKLLEKDLPPSITERPKQGFSIPLAEWFRAELKYLLDEYLRPERLKREGIFNHLEIKALVSAHLKHQANHTHLLWSLVTFQMWKERYLS